jgi:hypothetical protein
MQPKPATSTTFSCQLRKTLIMAPLESTAPGRATCCEKPVDCGVNEEPRPVEWRPPDEPPDDDDDMPLYRYFIKVSRTSDPPSLVNILCNMGLISDALIDCRTSVTVCRWRSYTEVVSVIRPHTMVVMRRTFTASDPPNGAFSHAPLNAPSASPPLSSCLT